ncbi:hypothetical protein I317_02070 [Kwoniella heveanensis CBS 569]|nr:hypothetical protein I317_02070 [Kwoniella heveanensis CBS 569]
MSSSLSTSIERDISSSSSLSSSHITSPQSNDTPILAEGTVTSAPFHTAIQATTSSHDFPTASSQRTTTTTRHRRISTTSFSTLGPVITRGYNKGGDRTKRDRTKSSALNANAPTAESIARAIAFPALTPTLNDQNQQQATASTSSPVPHAHWVSSSGLPSQANSNPQIQSSVNLIPVTTASNAGQPKPSRPPRSPLRPKLPSLTTRRKGQDSSIPVAGGSHRIRGDSSLSIGGIEYLRRTLESFRQALRTERDSSPELTAYEDTAEKTSSHTPRQRLSSITLSGFFGPGHLPPIQQEQRSQPSPPPSSPSNMSLSDQRSTQRLIDELMEDLTPRSPTGSIGPPAPPLPLPRNVDRVKRAGGHRRTYSSPGSVSVRSRSGTGTGSGSGSGSDVRGRTLSGGTFGRTLGSDGLLSDVETLRNGRLVNDGTASAPISPALKSTPLPTVQLPFIAARSNRASEATSSPHSTIAFPPAPAVGPITSDSLPSPPPLSPPSIGALPTPLVIQSPPLITPPVPEDTKGDKPFFQPTALPSLSVPPTPQKSVHRSSKTSLSPEVHPFAAVVAMMEEGDSPPRRRSRLSEKSSEEVPKSPGRSDKGNTRENGERHSEGRKQTPRRGLIGPGGIIPSLAKLRGAQSLQSFPQRPSEPHPIIVPIPPSPPSTAAVPVGQYTRTGTNTPATPIWPNSTTYLRPGPATPLTPFWSKPRFAVSNARQPSPSSSSRLPTPTPTHAPRNETVTSSGNGIGGLPQPRMEEGLIEIPRFKKKELNLGIVRTRGPRQKAAWIGLWAIWVFNGLLSLFFDVNVIYILVHAKTWQFATAAYAVLWAISTLAVWLGWEVGYEFWRRWRLARPAIEPMYMSLPASLHLSLISFNHFTFLLHIRASARNTPHSGDMTPETAHALLQLFPGLLPLLPRAAIAMVILISFWDPAADVTAPFGGSIDDKSRRDPHFFRLDSPGQLTGYARGVCVTFSIWVALRLVVVVTSGLVLWSFSGRPLGGLIGHRFSRKKQLAFSTRGPPTTPRKPKSSLQTRDPSTTSSPQKSWIEQENEFNWAWRDRARARIQDAFELCMIRRSNRGTGSFLYQGEIPWGRIIDQRSTRSVTGTGRHTQVQTPIEMGIATRRERSKRRPLSTEDFISSFVEGKEKQDPPDRHIRAERSTGSQDDNEKITPESKSTKSKSRSDKPRPESTLDPTSITLGAADLRPSPSRANTAASSSATDLFYTPMAGNTPQSEKTRSVAEGIHRLPPLPSEDDGRAAPPPSAYRPGGILTEFGVREGTQCGRGRDSPDSGSGEGEDESTGLLSATASATVSPRASILSRDRSASSASRDGSNGHPRSNSGTYSSTGGSASASRSSSRSRRRAYTTSSPGERLNRARSSSIGLLRESVANAAAAGGSFVRRARSGTMLSGTGSVEHGGYSKFGVNDGENQLMKPGIEADEREEVLDFGPVTPRSR